jgi:hypothetical protein
VIWGILVLFLISQHLARLPVRRFVKIGLHQFPLSTSNQLHLARPAADDVAGGSQCAEMSADWLLTWHTDCAWWCHTYIMLTSSWHAYCACWCHYCVRMTSSLSGSVTWVGSTGIRVGSAHPGEEDAWGASARVGRRLTGAWWRVRPCLMFDFDVVFTSGFVSSSSTQWYGQNIILTTFIFEQKSNTTLNHKLWYQL